MSVDGRDIEDIPVSNPDKFRGDVQRYLGEKYKDYQSLGPDLRRQINGGIFEAMKLRERGLEVEESDATIFSQNPDINIQNAHTQARGLEKDGGDLWISAIAKNLVDLTHNNDPKKRTVSSGDIPQIAEQYRQKFVAAQAGYENAVHDYLGENRSGLQTYLSQRHQTVTTMQGHPNRIQGACQEIDKFLTAKLEESERLGEELKPLEDQAINFNGTKDKAIILARAILLKEISRLKVAITLGRDTDDKDLATTAASLQETLSNDDLIPEWVNRRIKFYQESAERQKQVAAEASDDKQIFETANRFKRLGQGFTKMAKALKR